MGYFHGYMKTAQSLNRLQVDEALEKRGTDLLSFVEDRRGKSMEEIWMDLRRTTRVPFSVRTLYRWVSKEQS